MALKGYHSYRGRQSVLRVLLVIVLSLVLIAACAFLLLQRYITYSDDGSFYLDLPFEINWELPFPGNGDSSEEQNEDPEQDVNLIVDRPQENEADEDGETDPGNQEQEPVGEQEEPPKDEGYIVRRLIGLSQLPGDEAALMEALTSAGADGFVFTAKDREGIVNFSSAKAIAAAVADSAVSRELISLLCAQPGVYTVARISCMRDPVFGKANMAEAGVCKANGYIWYENDLGGHWLDAEKAAARQYVIEFAVECAQLGFDELLLENVCYPYRGNLYKIDYSKNTMAKVDALELFLDELRAALEPYGVRISLLLTDEEVRGISEKTEHSGMIVQQILPNVDAVYVETSDEETTRREMSDILGGVNVPALVPIVSEVTAGSGWYIPD